MGKLSKISYTRSMGKKVADVETTVAASNTLDDETMDSDYEMDNDFTMGDNDTESSVKPGMGQIVR